MTNFFKKLFSKKALPEMGSCFISNGECYKTFPLISSNNIIAITDITCKKKIIFKDDFFNKYGDYTIIEKEKFDKKADEFTRGQIKLILEDESEVKLLIARLKQCCPEWFEKHYGNSKTKILTS